MKTVDVKLPADLVEAANLENANVSQEAARLLALAEETKAAAQRKQKRAGPR